MKKADIFEFYRRLAELNPSPETELEFGNTYQLLVAVVLSAQATDVGVNKATRRLFSGGKDPAANDRPRRRGAEAAHQDDRTVQRQGERMSSHSAKSSSASFTARCLPTATRSSNCPGWGARPPMS
jgi:endonuclease III